MTIFEFLALLLISGGLVYGFLNGLPFGFSAALWYALKSAVIAYLYFGLGMFILLSVLSLWLRYRPFFPRCKTGRCVDSDYTYLYLDQPAMGADQELEERMRGKLVRCRCGTLYLESLYDHTFYEVLDNHTLVPYMAYNPLGRWHLVVPKE